jgi:hypothetical protein
MSIHLDPFDRRDIKVSAKHIYLGLVLGALVVAVAYWLDPKVPDTACTLPSASEQCRDDAASQNDGPIEQS